MTSVPSEDRQRIIDEIRNGTPDAPANKQDSIAGVLPQMQPQAMAPPSPEQHLQTIAAARLALQQQCGREVDALIVRHNAGQELAAIMTKHGCRLTVACAQ